MKLATTILALGLAGAATTARAADAERPITLNEAIRLAVQKNEGIVIARESAAAANAAVRGAKGAYDPLLTLDGAWLRSSEPTNSSFAGSLAQIAPEAR